MADTKSLKQQERMTVRQKEGVRAAIQATHIVKRLQAHINDEIDLKPTQIRAAEILLDRVVPRLQAVTVDPAAGSMDLLSILTEARNRVASQQPVVIEQATQEELAEVVMVDNATIYSSVDDQPIETTDDSNALEAARKRWREGPGTEGEEE